MMCIVLAAAVVWAIVAWLFLRTMTETLGVALIIRWSNLGFYQ